MTSKFAKLSSSRFKCLAGAALFATSAVASFAQVTPFIPNFTRTVSTVPANGDVNPYGVAFVPAGFPAGNVRAGDILVSNFNNNQNLQGTGTTIMRITSGDYRAITFFQGKAPLGLSTALAAVTEGVVLAGNFPSVDGTCATAKAGSLLVISNAGKLLNTLTNPLIDGPWDMAVNDKGNGTVQAFIANGLSGTIVRLDLNVTSTGASITKATQIASGYGHQCDPAAFVDAPTGLVYDSNTGNLFVASTLDNQVYRVANAGAATADNGQGAIIYHDNGHLHGALAMAMAPNGDLMVSDNDIINANVHAPSEITEFTTTGQFVKQFPIDPALGGSFGLNAQVGVGQGVPATTARFAAVDDNTSSLTVWYTPNFK
jgi:hypothetical protein